MSTSPSHLRATCCGWQRRSGFEPKLSRLRRPTRATIPLKGRENSVKARGLPAREAYADPQPLLADMRAKGMALQAIAGELNAQGHTTRRGKPWNPVQVMRVLERI
jgi:hypothetical protein